MYPLPSVDTASAAYCLRAPTYNELKLWLCSGRNGSHERRHTPGTKCSCQTFLSLSRLTFICIEIRTGITTEGSMATGRYVPTRQITMYEAISSAERQQYGTVDCCIAPAYMYISFLLHSFHQTYTPVLNSSTWGPRLGLRTMCQSRYSFG